MPYNRGVQDPITVILRDFGGSGQIIVECYGSAWSHWFGAIGTMSLRAFIAQCDACYLAGKLCSTMSQPFNKRTQAWVDRICSHVVKALEVQRCAACGYQYGHAIGCENNPVDAAIRTRGKI